MSFRLYSAMMSQSPPKYESNGHYICSRDNRLVACVKGEKVTLFEIRTGKKIASFETSPKGDNNCAAVRPR